MAILERTVLIQTFSKLGELLKKWGNEDYDSCYEGLKMINLERNDFENAIRDSQIFNGWFVEEAVRENFKTWGNILTQEQLQQWLQNYNTATTPKKVGLILAGNIPMVGFHDILSVIFSGNKALIKLSQDDKILIPLLLNIATKIQPDMTTSFEYTEKLKDIDAIIATGSDNTARYFEKYFGHIPHIIRKNRTAIAVLNGNETKKEIYQLGKDIFTYFGLGCRNVTHLLLPKNYNLNDFFGPILPFKEVINHNKYGNNYDYYKAIFLMNNEKITENGFVLLRETKELFSPVAVLHYHFYSSPSEIEHYLSINQEKIQVVIGKNYTPFGNAQCPTLNDYADGVDTMAFLTQL